MAASIAGLEKEARYCEFIAIGLRGCTGGLSLIAAQMQSRQHRAASRIEKFVRVPSGRQRSGFRLAVADHHGHNQIRVVEGGAVGVRYPSSPPSWIEPGVSGVQWLPMPPEKENCLNSWCSPSVSSEMPL